MKGRKRGEERRGERDREERDVRKEKGEERFCWVRKKGKTGETEER